MAQLPTLGGDDHCEDQEGAARRPPTLGYSSFPSSSYNWRTRPAHLWKTESWCLEDTEPFQRALFWPPQEISAKQKWKRPKGERFSLLFEICFAEITGMEGWRIGHTSLPHHSRPGPSKDSIAVPVKSAPFILMKGLFLAALRLAHLADSSSSIHFTPELQIRLKFILLNG